MVPISIQYEGNLRCRATHGPSGTELVTDAPVDNHGKGESFSPTDLVAAALGGCLATIMGIVAERHGLDLAGLHISVEKEMTAEPVRRIGTLRVRVTMPAGITPEDRRRLESAALRCPVKESLAEGVSLPVEFVYPD